MLGRRKKGGGSSNDFSSNLDLAGAAAAAPSITDAAPSTSARAFNFILERAKGAVGLGAKERSSNHATSLQGRPGPASPTRYFARASTDDLNARDESSSRSLPTSSSMSDLKKSSTFFSKRQTTAPTSTRPSWLSIESSARGRNNSTPPLTFTPESPSLGTGGEERKGVYLATPVESSSDISDSLSTSRTALTKSSEDILSRAPRSTSSSTSLAPPPLTTIAQKSSEDMMKAFGIVRSRTSSEESTKLGLKSSRSRTTSSSSLKLDRISSAHPSPPLVSISKHKTSKSLSGINDSSTIQFPTSSSTPNFHSPPIPDDQKRNSQTILIQGFLQRKADYAPAVVHRQGIPTNTIISSPTSSPVNLLGSRPLPSVQNKSASGDIDLQRGWKPYKVYLRGAKLYLHKLPGDLSSTAKARFPTTMIDDRDSQVLEFGPGLTQADHDAGRKQQRVFWGTGGVAHPGLIVNSSSEKGKERERVQGGTLEALMHELVFGTSFNDPSSSSSSTPPLDSIPTYAIEAESLYDFFLHTLILAGPFLPFSPSHSASELDRCAGLATRTVLNLSTREEGLVNVEALALGKRLEKIVRIVLDLYPEDLRVMENGTSRASPTKVAFEQVIFQLKSLESTTEGEGVRASEELSKGMEEAFKLKKVVRSPTEFSHSRTSSRQGSGSNSGSPSKARRRGSSEQEPVSTALTLTPINFLASDPIAFADQIHSFHLNRLTSLTGSSSLSRQFMTASKSLNSTPSSPPVACLFSFSPSRPHFLTRLVIDTILAPTSASANQWLSASPPQALRAALIVHWISVAEELRSRGDAAGFVAIAMALCSRAIARLDDTWRRISSEKIQPVRQEWTAILTGLGFADEDDVQISSYTVAAVQIGTEVPYFGTVLEESARAIRMTRTPVENHPGAVDLTSLYSLHHTLQLAEKIWSGNTPATLDTRLDTDLQHLFQHLSRLPSPARPHLSAYITASLEVEVASSPLSASDLQFKVRPSTGPNPLLPLIMIEPLPHISLIDRPRIVQLAGRALSTKQSITSIPAEAALALHPTTSRATPSQRLARHNSYPPSTLPASLDRTTTFARFRNEIANPSDTLLRFADGDLVLRVVSTVLPAIPQASPARGRDILNRTASWIETRSPRPGASRRGSVASTSGGVPDSRRVSLLAGSPGSERNSLITSPLLQVAGEEEPVNVNVKAGTIDSLVDLLVVGIAETVRAPTTDADGEESLNTRRPFRFDSKQYRQSFFATFRAFISPLVLLDMLRKRYLAASSASQEYPTLSSARPFPTWSLSTDEAEVDWSQVASIRLAIISVLRHWVENHILDFLGDDELFTSASTFISFVERTETAAQETEVERQEDDEALRSAKVLKLHFVRDCLRPPTPFKRSKNSEHDETLDFSFDGLSASALLDRLDRLATAVNRDITERDLIGYSEVLEATYLINPTSWYLNRPAGRDDDELVITDLYTHLLSLSADPAFFIRMPASLRHCLRAHSTIRRWIIGHLVDPNIPLIHRQQRMIKAIEIVELSRSRMSNVIFGGQADVQPSIISPSLASFIERVFISAIVSPESRLFASAWQNVAASRGIVAPDSLVALVRKTLTVTDSTSTLDIAWLNERLLEVVTQVDTLSDGVPINFDKRRLVYNIVVNALAISPSHRIGNEVNGDLDAMEKRIQTGWGGWAIRMLRDVAGGEGTKVTKGVRPFNRLVHQQQEKVRRDKQAREFIVKGQKIEQQNRAQRDRESSRTTEKSTTFRSRRMTAIFRSVIPATAAPSVSPLFSSPSPSAIQALNDWTPASKPYLVLALSGLQVEVLENRQRSFVFELATEDGQRSIFQATSRRELENWLMHLRQSGTQIAVRRATFLAQTALAEEPEEPALVKSAPVKVSSKGIFSVPLWEVLAREGSSIPIFFEKALRVLEERGLSEVGIYRISGENRVIHEMKDALNRGVDSAAIIERADIHNLSGIVKLFLREMPEPLIPFDLYHEFIEANGIQDYDERLYALRDLIWRMPSANFALLRRLTEHLDRVTDNEGVNAMHAANLAIIFAPTLLKPAPGPSSFAISMTNLGKSANIIKSLILQSFWLFDQVAEEVAEEIIEGTPSEQHTAVPSEDVEVKPLPASPLFSETPTASPALPDIPVNVNNM